MPQNLVKKTDAYTLKLYTLHVKIVYLQGSKKCLLSQEPCGLQGLLKKAVSTVSTCKYFKCTYAPLYRWRSANI